MPSFKINRLAEDIRRELTDLMHTLKDPRVQGMVSIVRVELSGDQGCCKVYVSSLDGAEAGKRAAQGLNNAAGYIRREMGRRVEMRRTPEFRFLADDSIEYSAGISQKLHELLPDAGKASGSPDKED
ncbi:MAG: 30S ribosome-binding factor RbfA [Provencibacterium sp.]|jgi:ribosome-binding factor A|nr:30S ribosome-binding factor RbfA [Provencibacterium sp.]